MNPAEPATLDTVPARRGRWRAIAISVVSVVVALAVMVTALVVWSVRRAFPNVTDDLAVAGMTAPVTVYRDSYGIPQVYARSATDLFRAQGYLHAQDRFWEMDFRRHITAGRLSELFGESQVPTDAFLRTLGWRRLAEQELPMLSADARSFLSAYAEGVNSWIEATGGSSPSGAKGLEYTVLGLTNGDYTVEPWSPVDSLAWLKAMAWDLKGNYDAELNRAILLGHGLTKEQIDQLYPAYPYSRNVPIVDGAVVDGAFQANAPATGAASTGTGNNAPASVWRDAEPVLAELSKALGSTDNEGIGSNSWVVSGALTKSGKPLLANDPHLNPSMPGIWYQMGLHCTCEFNVEGFTFSGVPGVVIGHNARVAWGFTNLNPDVTDLYLEKVDGDRVFDGSVWTDLQQRDEVIKVAGKDPVTIRVRSTKHGPLVSDRSSDLLSMALAPAVDASGSPRPSVSPVPAPSLDTAAAGVPSPAAQSPYAVALRWTALDAGRTMESVFALNTASNWSEFRAAAALFEVPSQNLVYADVDGNIGYQAPGRIPVRGKGDGLWPAIGWDAGYDWTGYLPFAELPSVLNPPQGWIVAANQAVTGTRYQDYLGNDWAYGYRSQRVNEMLTEAAAKGKIDAEGTRLMQFDSHNGFAPDVVSALKRISPASLPPAADMLFGWDYQQPAEGVGSAPAALFNVFWSNLLKRTFDELPGDFPLTGNERSFEVVRTLLSQQDSSWWDVRSTPQVETRDDILAVAMRDAVAELSDRLGDDPTRWQWGDLHTLALVNATFGTSGIAPIEWLFNRGPRGVTGGSGLVNATGWSADEGYEVTAVPSMRMIVDLSNLDQSRWVQLTGNSGHAFHANYDDQFDLWRTGQNLQMPWDLDTVKAQAAHPPQTLA